MAVSSAVLDKSINYTLRDDKRSEELDIMAGSASSDAAGGRVFLYKPSQSRRRGNLARFVAKTRSVDPDGAAKLEDMFASLDIVDAVGDKMRKVGLSSNNVADAYAVWWVIAWYAVQGRESESSLETMAAVRQQAANSILATGKIGSASDATKQEMAEALIIQAAMVDGANDQMRGDRAQQRTLSTAVNKGARAMGLDLTSMTLTSEGFQRRRGSDAIEAIEAVEGAELKTLAASLTSDAPSAAANDSTGTYALLAAAGGAGLVAMFIAGRASGRKG